MSEFLGARISLISKSDIRYSGVLHDINSEESTVSLENVRSFGTEGRRGGNPDDEIAPADQVYEYIVFRGNDVKDLRIEEGPTSKETNPSNVPNDPAIVGARPRPMNGNAPPSFHQGPPLGPQGQIQPGGPGFAPNMPIPPHPNAWGPQGPPQNFQYPPPPGWYPPQGMGFPGSGPDPWGNYYNPAMGPYGPGGPGVPNNSRAPPQQQQQPQQSHQPQQQQPPHQQPPKPSAEVSGSRPSPIGAGAEKQKGSTSGTSDIESKPLGQPPAQKPAGRTNAVTGSRGARAPTAEAKKPETPSAISRNGSAEAAPTQAAAPVLPTGPKGARIAPIVPLPAGLVSKTVKQTTAISSKPPADAAANAAALRDATAAAKAAVAVAMARLEGGAAAAASGSGAAPATSAVPGQFTNGFSAIDNLTRKVNEMRVNATQPSGPSNDRGRGRGGINGGRAPKTVLPDTDFDFATANAKFNKEDVVKEASAAHTPLETESSSTEKAAERLDDAVGESTDAPPAYNKTKSFFDNISSEAKDRAEKGGQKAGGREWRGEEQRRNIETFGQGSVDGGYRGYRGRGRGRGRGGFNRGRGGGGNGGYRRTNESQHGVAS